MARHGLLDPDVLASSYAFAGPDKMVMGSDYPHQIGDLEHCVARVKAMNIGEEEQRKILGENAAKLLKL